MQALVEAVGKPFHKVYVMSLQLCSQSVVSLLLTRKIVPYSCINTERFIAFCIEIGQRDGIGFECRCQCGCMSEGKEVHAWEEDQICCNFSLACVKLTTKSKRYGTFCYTFCHPQIHGLYFAAHSLTQGLSFSPGVIVEQREVGGLDLSVDGVCAVVNFEWVCVGDIGQQFEALCHFVGVCCSSFLRNFVPQAAAGAAAHR